MGTTIGAKPILGWQTDEAGHPRLVCKLEQPIQYLLVLLASWTKLRGFPFPSASLDINTVDRYADFINHRLSLRYI